MASNRKNGRPQGITREQGDRIIALLEQTHYAIADVDTGIENCLHQLKIMNRKLEELVDKRR